MRCKSLKIQGVCDHVKHTSSRANMCLTSCQGTPVAHPSRCCNKVLLKTRLTGLHWRAVLQTVHCCRTSDSVRCTRYSWTVLGDAHLQRHTAISPS